MEEEHPQHHGPQGEHVDGGHGIAHKLPVGGVDGGIGAAVGAGGGLAVVEHDIIALGKPGDHILPQGFEQRGIVGPGGQVIKGHGCPLPVVDGGHVDAGYVPHGPLDVLRGGGIVDVLHEDGAVGHHLGGPRQGLVPGAALLDQVEHEAHPQGQQQGDDDAQQEHLSDLQVHLWTGVFSLTHGKAGPLGDWMGMAWGKLPRVSFSIAHPSRGGEEKIVILEGGSVCGSGEGGKGERK